MKQLTLRGFDAALEKKLREMARREGISLNQAALRLMRRGAGLKSPGAPPDVVGDSLDHLAGTWSEAEAREFSDSIVSLESIDETLWK